MSVTAVAIVVVGGLGLLVAVTAEAGPVHHLRCLFEDRDGWIVELPSDARTPADVRAAVRQQTTWVAVDVGTVNWNQVAERELAVAIVDPRTWVQRGDEIKV